MKQLEKRVRRLEEEQRIQVDPSEPRTMVLMSQVCKVKDGQIVERLGPSKIHGRWWKHVENVEEKSI